MIKYQYNSSIESQLNLFTKFVVISEVTRMGPKIIRNSKLYDQIQDGEKFLLNHLSKASNLDGWTIYEQPHLNGDRPDFVLCHPEKGVVIIEVKDWRLDSQNYKAPGLVLGNNGKWIDKNPEKQIKKYKDNLRQFISKQYLTIEEQFNNDAYAIIECVIYFHNADADSARAYCGLNLKSHTKVIGRKQVESIGSNQFNSSGIQTICYNQSKFTHNGLLQRFVNDLQTWLNPSDYHKGRLNPINLWPDQKQYIDIKQNSYRRLSGVAGSGKSLILATKAANMLKQSNRVLVLTFNITLRHYLRDLISQQFGLGDRTLLRDELVILHFHDFIKKIAYSHEINLPESSGEDFELQWIETIKQLIPPSSIVSDMMFDGILIDEGQDFKSEWVIFIKTFFTKKTEIFICYDIDQDLYGRQKEVWIENAEEIRGIGFRGRPGRLKITHRLPGRVVQAITLIRKRFGLINKEEILVPEEQLDFFTEMTLKNFNSIKSNKSNLVLDELQQLLQKGVKIDDIAILTTNELTGVTIVNILKNKGFSLSHVFDLSGSGNKKERKNEKWKFQPGNGRLKVSTVHSFKGWEASHIIFLLDSPNNEKSTNNIEENVQQLLFIALSRVRYYDGMDFCSFTCLNFLPQYNDLQEIFNL